MLPTRVSSVGRKGFVASRQHLLNGSKDCDGNFDRIQGEHRDVAILSYNRGPSHI